MIYRLAFFCSFFLFSFFFFFFFNDTATTEIYTLSLHDALPSPSTGWSPRLPASRPCWYWTTASTWSTRDRKSTRLNSRHPSLSYAVFCLKKKKEKLVKHARALQASRENTNQS